MRALPRFVGYGPSRLHAWRVGAVAGSAPQVDVVQDALCLPVVQQGGRLAGGLIDAAGRYLAASGLETNGRPFVGAPQGPVPEAAEVLSGRSFYVGPCHPHYGHFLVETVAARLWCLERAQLDAFDHFVVMPTRGAVPPFVREFFTLLGVADRLRVIRQPTLLRHVTVPHAAAKYPATVHRAVAAVHRLVPHEGPAGEDERPLLVSRAALVPGQVRLVLGEAVIEDAVAREGARVFHPERHGLAEQIAAFRQHRTIIGFAGSALHTLILSGGGARVVAYSARPAPAVFPLLDQALGNQASYVRAALRVPGLARLKTGFQPEILDVHRVVAVLRAHGLLSAASAMPALDVEHWRAAYNAALLLRHVLERAQTDGEDTCRAFIATFRRHFPVDDGVICEARQGSPLFGRLFAD